MPSYKGLSDHELVPLLTEGNEAAFTEIYSRYRQPVYRFLYKFLKSPELTDDIAQEVFMKLLEGREKLYDIRSLRSYLFTLAKNHAFNFLKRAAVDINARAAIVRYYAVSEDALEEQIHAADYKRYLDELIGTLTPQSREVFRLCRQEGRTYDETAELLGISRNTVKKHMTRSMRILSDSVERDLGISLIVLLALIYRS